MANDLSIPILLRLLDEAYDRKAWHGPNLKGTIRGLDARAATWRASAKRHNIRELVIHAAYWKYAVRRRLTGIPRSSFPLQGSNWFRRETPDEQEWRSEVALLDAQHRELRKVVEALKPKDLSRRVGTHDFARLIYGAAAHDLYHTGQIALLKRFYSDAR